MIYNSKSNLQFVLDDGGREAAGFRGWTGDCVVRSIAIATEKPYSEVYDVLFAANKHYAANHHSKLANSIGHKSGSPRNGNNRKVFSEYLKSLGWKWIPTMKIGSGCTVHLRDADLPTGRIIALVSKHLTCVIDHQIRDTHDPSRDGTRCVYGYFIKA